MNHHQNQNGFLSDAARGILWDAVAAHQPDVHDGTHDLAHLGRVRASALRLFAAEGGKGNGAALEAAAILHDLVAIEKNDARRPLASRIAADAAMPWMERAGLDASTMAIAHHAIVAHSWSAGVDPQTIEAKILRDADRLDALGAIGVARCIMTAGRLGQSLYDPQDPHALHRDRNDTLFCHDHFHVKLYHLQDGLSTNAARQEAARRMDVMKAFWDDLFQEAGVDAQPR